MILAREGVDFIGTSGPFARFMSELKGNAVHFSIRQIRLFRKGGRQVVTCCAYNGQKPQANADPR